MEPETLEPAEKGEARAADPAEGNEGGGAAGGKDAAEKSQPVENLRTFERDIADLAKKGLSLSEIAIAEGTRQRGRGVAARAAEESPQSKKLLLLSGGLIVLGAIAAGAFFLFRPAAETAEKQFSIQPLISADVTKEIEATGATTNALLRSIAGARDAEYRLGSVVALYFTKGRAEQKTSLGAGEFANLLLPHMPGELRRAFAGAFLFGVYRFKGNEPFLLFKITDFQNAFAGMLAWEKGMKDDLEPLFPLRQKDAAGGAESAEGFLEAPRGFSDIVIKNRDARILLDENGRPIILYSFPDQRTLVITTNAETLTEVSKRLFAGALVQ